MSMSLPAILPVLTITSDTAFAILLKARQFDVKVEETDPDSGSNPTDDTSIDALEFGTSDDMLRELTSAISDLNDDEQSDLVALVFLGRGDFTLEEWREAKKTAADIGRQHIIGYLTQIPLVSDYLQDGLSLFDLSIEDYLDSH